ncbi:uncharacterized protein TNCT_183951 [Trichonephila clavata]|uniref:Integrase catalytic domain-containing protein n=1 Tax=Trichonephila clavata TaxID=2740835 RepID=A0A8X6HY79_TRICU|nr:uncharacterized protein TNCT_183951 [Trichonephila clavata]
MSTACQQPQKFISCANWISLCYIAEPSSFHHNCAYTTRDVSRRNPNIGKERKGQWDTLSPQISSWWLGINTFSFKDVILDHSCSRTEVRKILRKCVTYFRHKNVFSQQLIGDLPVSRVNPGRTFSKSGVDIAGLFQVMPRRGRGVRALKTYTCIFVCFITKAVHLELVGATTFIAVLKRFIVRRGSHEELYSDCGANFLDACRELRKSGLLMK